MTPIENVQRRATKMIPKIGNLEPIEWLKIRKLPCLTYRRLKGDMIEVYKLTNGKYDPEVTEGIFKKHQTGERMQTRGHSKSLEE